jgi:hypothetical protein
MTRLATLRSQLAALRRARALVRGTTAWSSLGTALLWALAGIFLLDVVFELEVPQRVVVIALAIGAVARAGWRFTRPLLEQREDDVDMALLVERQQKIDSDLVAALQFESADAPRWGSPQLEGAVIDYVSAVGRGINVFEGFNREQMVRRGTLLGVSLVAVLAAAAVFPGHAKAFVNRLLLGSQHYPTATVIEKIAVNDREVLIRAEHGARPITVKAAQGKPLKFRVLASGKSPAKGIIRVVATGPGRSKTSFDLEPLKNEPTQPGNAMANTAEVVFTGEMSRLMENISYKVFLGDAWTDAATIEMVPLPAVESRLALIPPKYASVGKDQFDPTARQVSVLEGSSLEIAVHSTNNKPLEKVALSVKSGDQAARLDLKQQDAEGLAWALPAGTSPFKNIRTETRYEIEAVDADGLSPEVPIRGTIRIRPDRPPSGSAEVVHKVVLPSAEPVIEYRANDDYGLSQIALIAEIERQDPSRLAAETTDLGQGTLTPAKEVPAEIHRYSVLPPGKVVRADRLPLVAGHRLSLSPLKLAKGDRVKLTLEVTDYRGENDAGEPVGAPWQSDPLVLEISDESGVLAAISEADQRSEQRLTDIIKRQLGIGETP